MAGTIPESWGKAWGHFAFQSLVPEVDDPEACRKATRMNEWLRRNCQGMFAWVTVKEGEALVFTQERDAILFEMFRKEVFSGETV